MPDRLMHQRDHEKIAVSNDLSTAVAECGLVPWFFQVIVVPTLTLISFGTNSKSFI